MRRIHRIVMLAGLVLLAPALSGCENFDLDKLDVFGLNEKKKLPGDRKPLFPEGVPGVSQGIPPEYVKGNQPPPDTTQTVPAGQDANQPATEPSKTATVEPAAQPKPKRKPKPRATTAAPAQPAAQTQSGGQQPASQQNPAPWPTQGQSSSSAPWPSSPQPGTFSR